MCIVASVLWCNRLGCIPQLQWPPAGVRGAAGTSVCVTPSIRMQTYWIRTHRYMYSTMPVLLDPMVTLSNGSFLRFNGPLCGEFNIIGEFLSQRVSNVDFDVGPHKLLNEQSNDR